MLSIRIYNIGVLARFSTFKRKDQTRQIVKIYKDFELYQVFMYIFFVSKYPNISNRYYPQKELKHFGLVIFSDVRDISTESYKRRFVIFFCAELF